MTEEMAQGAEIDQVETAQAGEEQQTESFVLESGEYDAAKWAAYLQTLSPEDVAGLLDSVVERSLEVEFEDGEVDKILHEVVLNGHYKKPVEVIPGYRLTFRSLSREDHDWVIEPGLGERDANKVEAARSRHVRLLAASVTLVGGERLPDQRDERARYWSKQNNHVVDIARAAAERFDRLVRAALMDKEAWGNS